MEPEESSKKKPVLKRKGEQSEESNTEVAPGVMIPSVLADTWPEVEKTKRPCINIKATPAGNLALTASKFGGYPCLPIGFQYPRDKQGKFLFPLLQINCSELPRLEGFPDTGFLQCYISGFDGMMGMNTEHPARQDNFRVLYFTPSELIEYQSDFGFLAETMTSDVPVPEPYQLTFSTGTDYVGIGDVAYFADPALALLAERFPEKAAPGVLSMDSFVCAGHKMGGYNCFTQGDLRTVDEKYKDYISLFQIDSEDEIMWGDMGLGHFFIHPDALIKKDFSQVLYYWDCF